MYGYYRISSAIPKLKIADIDYNTTEILKCIDFAKDKQISIMSFPELCVTGYSCGDIFYQDDFLSKAKNALNKIVRHSFDINCIFIIGLPLQINERIYNCAPVIINGKIIGIVIRTGLANNFDYINKKYFCDNFNDNDTFNDFQNVKIGSDLLFKINNDFTFCVRISKHIKDLLFFKTKEPLLIIDMCSEVGNFNNQQLIRDIVINTSNIFNTGNIYISISSHESTSDTVYSGYSMIVENGFICCDNNDDRKNIINKQSMESAIIFSEIDVNKLTNLRKISKNIDSNFINKDVIDIRLDNKLNDITRIIYKYPFLTLNNGKFFENDHFFQIFKMQVIGLANRIKYVKAKKLIIGISGGVDSTWALIIAISVCEFLNKPKNDVIACIMPYFKIRDKNYENALKICQLLNCDIKEIDIKKICDDQINFLKIKHNSIAYENVQARQRTAILMNIANKENGIVVGTNDLSEIALGWTTYSGDHMSMYSVNCGLTKSLIVNMIKWYIGYSKNDNHIIGQTLKSILESPFSPGLIVNSDNLDDRSIQRTEDIIGPFELHDFFLFNFVFNKFSKEKIIFLANIAFKDIYCKDYIKKCFDIFIKRLFSQQFKRNCSPDGPMVGINNFNRNIGFFEIPSDIYTFLNKNLE